MNPPLSIIILAAGLGTRMKSRQAKVLHRAGGKSLAEHVLDAALELTTPENVYVVIGHQADAVRKTLSSRGVSFVLQTEQKGTGHAVICCGDTVRTKEGDVLILYGDTPLLTAATLRRLYALHAESGASTAITTFLDDPTGYGRIIRNEAGEVTAVVEQKAVGPEQLSVREINAGIYCFDAALLWKHLADIQPNNPAREYYLTDMVEILNKNGHRVLPMVVEDSSELLGINNRIELAEADRILRARKVRELMLEGVTIERPETVTVDRQARIGMDTVVEPFARILGNTTIGSNCRVGAGAIIENSEIADGVEIQPMTMVASSRIETGCHIGPFARLRMENHVESGAHIGNFVELKKTRLGAGAKASHLAYLGDSAIGAAVNIGAGTITCNYDGRKKHQTRIGPGAFIGSNSTLVAPVEVGDGAYVGAGSVITDAVPADSLALGRGRQVVKDQWAKRRRDASGEKPRVPGEELVADKPAK